MDTASKERLVGAIMFVVLIVLLVPEILSGPHHPVPSVSGGPTGEAPLRTYTIDLGNPVKPSSPPSADAKPPALPRPPAEGTAVSVSGPSVPATLPAVPVTVAQPAPSAKPAPTGAAPAAAASTPAADGKEAWGAQLGSFSNAQNAERLAQNLRSKGYHAFVSPTGTGSHVLHRVRVGPEPTRAAAQTLIARLKRDGETAKVVTLP
jgi:DedD protein